MEETYKGKTARPQWVMEKLFVKNYCSWQEGVVPIKQELVKVWNGCIVIKKTKLQLVSVNVSDMSDPLCPNGLKAPLSVGFPR